MSFVVFTGCQYFGIMFGDRRCSDEEGNIINENVQKVKRINDKLIIGAGGDEVLIRVIWRKIFEYVPLEELSYNDCIELVTNKFSELLPEIKEFASKGNILKMNMGIASNWNNIIEFASIDVLGEKINVRKCRFTDDDDILFCYMAKGLGNLGEYCNEFFNKSGRKYSLTNLKSVFYQTIKNGCKTDYTINDRFNCEYVIRSDIYDEKRDAIK